MQVQPFKFGVATSDEYFTDRVEETKRLVSNFENNINTILISPRRWGKTSLVKKAISKIDSEAIKVVFLDIFACRTEGEFCNMFATAVLKQTSSKWQEWVRNAQEFLARVSPRITLGTDPTTDISFSIDLKDKTVGIEETLQLPEKIAQRNNCRIVVCIDEFQQIGEFTDALIFQKKLRAIWQHQTSVSYCLFGSKKHLMSELFGRKDYPFYKFGDTIYLEKIGTADWVAYIRERFTGTGKEVSETIAEQICRSVDNHSSYVQQLSWLVWGHTTDIATERELDLALQDIIDQNRPLFEKQIEDLTAYQLSFLRAIVDGVEESFASQEVIDKYNLSSSSNVAAIKTALVKKELIDIEKGKVVVTDPVLPLWMKRYLRP